MEPQQIAERPAICWHAPGRLAASRLRTTACNSILIRRQTANTNYKPANSL